MGAIVDKLTEARAASEILMQWGRGFLKISLRNYAFKSSDDNQDLGDSFAQLINQLERFDNCCSRWRELVTIELVGSLELCGLDPVDGKNSITNDVCSQIFRINKLFLNLPGWPESNGPFNAADKWKACQAEIRKRLPLDCADPDAIVDRETRKLAREICKDLCESYVSETDFNRVLQEFAAAIRFQMQFGSSTGEAVKYSNFDKDKQFCLDYKNDGNSWDKMHKNSKCKFKRDAITTYARETGQVVLPAASGRPSREQ